MRKVLSLVLALLMVGMVGCDTQPVQEPDPAPVYTGEPLYGGHLDVKTTQQITGIDPLKQVGSWKFQWTSAVYEPMLTRDSQNNIQPCVCDYVLSEYREDPEGPRYTELLLWPREGYTFSHGYGQVTLEDVQASFARGLELYAPVKKYVQPNVLVLEQVAATDAVKAKDPNATQVLRIVFAYHEMNLYYLATENTWWPVMPREICEQYADSYIVDQLEDGVGTGPYEFSELKDGVYVALTKREDYVPVLQDEDQTGMAATKWGYLDSMTFWYNAADVSSASAPLAQGYDCMRDCPPEYIQLAEQCEYAVTKMPTKERFWIYFNTNGTNNLVAKYPSLRKAVMAAIDYPSYLEFVTYDEYTWGGDNIMLAEQYDVTDEFKAADYYGAYNQEVVDKYMALAKEEGYKGEPLQIPHSVARTDISTMTAATMVKAGIPFELVPNTVADNAAFISDPNNNWDFYFDWGVTYPTPGTMEDRLVEQNFCSDRVQEIRQELWRLEPGSEEYLALWEEWTDIWVEECQVGYLGAAEWWWWHPDTLHINDGGDDPEDLCQTRYFYNTYWEDPQNHPIKHKK